MHCPIFILLVTTLLLASRAKAQPNQAPIPQRYIVYLHDSVATASSDSLRAYYWAEIARWYYFYRHITPHWHDSAMKYNKLSAALSERKKLSTFQYRARRLELNMSFALGQHDKAIAGWDRIRDTNTVQILSSWGRFYAGSSFDYTRNLDSALYLFQKALAISEALHQKQLIARAQMNIANVYCRKKDTVAAKKIAAHVMTFLGKEDDLIAAMWYEIGINAPLIEPFFAFKKAAYLRSMELVTLRKESNSLPSQSLTGLNLISLSDIYEYTGQDSMSMVCMMKALELLAPIKHINTFTVQMRLHDKYYYRGNFDKALSYALEALKGAHAAGYRNLHQVYLYIGNNCFELGQVAKSIEYYEKGIATAMETDKKVSGVLIKRLAKSMVAMGRPAAALKMVQEAQQTFLSFTSADSMLLEEAYGISYHGLRNYDLAEKHYRQMGNYIPRVPKIQAAICPIVWGKFYYERGQYDRAIPYMKQCLQMPPTFVPSFVIGDIYLMLYRIDSTRQQYQSALHYYLQYRTINDSIYRSKQEQALETLRSRFDLDEKDRELQLRGIDIRLLMKEKLLQQSLAEQTRKDALLKQQSIDLLTQEASLQELMADKQQLVVQQQQKDLRQKQENIDLLQSREQMQEARIRQSDFIKQLTIGGIILLFIIVVLLYSRYHTRKKTSKAISKKNDELQQLVEDKEWLLKEVHHRVKNNLQVVLSLLQSQSAYLQDEALEAVHNSQHRVQAMSLIHQKLYQSDNIASINMDTYIPELVNYLQESFAATAHIRFILNISPTTLDVKQAIPLGLIINEAVTNAFKHAFPQQQNGHVSIALQPLNEQEMILDIQDDGVGLGTDSSVKRKGSLGMSLMKGLCSDFNARNEISGTQGTKIRVIFPRSTAIA
ncbi:histidine kinase dimerization/phosphoacceptor domain -containing protein [Paraflavitalea pollutisoli]|uniref:histidine kinase dimerization/phosphoacceptor domain -containing protein n=1 Tax=Paraflavitalea pollutisoli TaxID=3034143 RepID=UPI0023EC1ECE|nr:histidine kinase dimerization/phosphoacceptor domain -containing protein [Paraflavitalea sp. H1-2-19X]